MYCDGTFDIECERWDRFVMGAIHLDGVTTVYRHNGKPGRRERDMVEALLEPRGLTFAAHYGGKYDLLWLVQWIGRLERDESRRIPLRGWTAGGRIVTAKIGRGKRANWFRDSYSLLNFKLAKVAEIAGLEKLETGLRCRCKERWRRADPETGKSKGCGGYCRIRRYGMSESERRALERYLRRDVEALKSALDKFEHAAASAGLEVKGTAGGSAWHTVRARKILEPAVWGSRGEYELAAAGYCGGRTECLQWRMERASYFDIASSYPYALTIQPVPYGRYSVLGPRQAARAYRRGREGIYHARVHVPEDMFFPPLPVRMRDHLAFPVGMIEGAWPRIELAYAESLGCRIESISIAIVWPRAKVLFRRLMREIFALRKEHGGALGEAFKLYGNATTGKFGQSPDSTELRIAPEKTMIRDGWRMLGPSGLVWEAPTSHIPEWGHVQISAYLTARARIRLHQQIVADGHGGRRRCYLDTDSCVSERGARIIERGTELGRWKHEAEIEEWLCLAPKVYRYRCLEDGRRRWVCRSKGIPDVTPEEFDRLERAETIDRGLWGVMGYRSAVKNPDRHWFAARSLSRGLATALADRIWWGSRKRGEDGRTYPVTLDELRAAGWRDAGEREESGKGQRRDPGAPDPAPSRAR